MCPLHLQILLLMALLWPVIFLGGTTDALRWAHYIGRCCCQLLHFGPLYLWKALLIHSDGPIASVDAAANSFDLAYYFFGGTSDALRWAHCIGNPVVCLLAFGYKIFVK